jgi:hypothetical protein
MKQHQDYDKIFKESFQSLSQTLLSNLIGIDTSLLQPVSTTLPRTIERRADFVAIGKNPQTKQQEIFHIEFQSQVHLKMAKRGLLYYGLLFDKYELPVNQYVIYLGSGTWTASKALEHQSLSYQYQVISINEIDYDTFVKSEKPEEIVFAILANFKGEDKGKVIQKIISALENRTKNHKKLQKFIQQLEILSNLRNLQLEIIKQISTMSIIFDIKQDIRFQQGIEQGVEQGIEQGISIQDAENKRAFAKSLIENTDFEDTKIAMLVAVSKEYVSALRKELATK